MKLDWNNAQAVENAVKYIVNFVSTWNSRTVEQRKEAIPLSPTDDPCLLDTNSILTSNTLNDYIELVDRVQ